MKLYEARDNAGQIILRHNYVKHLMMPVGFAESHTRFWQLGADKRVKPVTTSTYRYYIR